VKRIIYIGLFALAALSSSCNWGKPKTDYQVIVVGGGLAGLSTAANLSDQSVLLIEKENRLGGRVYTDSFEGIHYDLGAVFAFDTAYAHFGNTAPYHANADSIVIVDSNSRYSGMDVMQCMHKMDKHLFDQFASFKDKKITRAENSSADAYHIMNRLYQSVNPEALQYVASQKQQDVFIRYNAAHFLHGNAILVQHLSATMHAKVQLNSKVIKVLDHDNWVEVLYLDGADTVRVTSDRVVVTTPAPIAKKIIQRQALPTRNLFQQTKYAGYITVALVIKDFDWGKYAYMVTCNTSISSIVCHRTDDKTKNVYLFYFAESELPKMKDQTDSQLVNYCYQYLSKMAGHTAGSMLHSSVKHWPYAGVVIDEETYGDWDPNCLKPSKNVYLAGDYTSTKYMQPYGMIPAVMSGEAAADAIKQDIKSSKR
jgi:monoamine oxidase